MHEDPFPLGDGVADLTAWVVCPYCGEEIELAVDPGGGAVQQYVEDCEVCCNPWLVRLTRSPDGRDLAVSRADGSE